MSIKIFKISCSLNGTIDQSKKIPWAYPTLVLGSYHCGIACAQKWFESHSKDLLRYTHFALAGEVSWLEHCPDTPRLWFLLWQGTCKNQLMSALISGTTNRCFSLSPPKLSSKFFFNDKDITHFDENSFVGLTILKAAILPFLTDKNGILIWFDLIVALIKEVKHKIVNLFLIFKLRKTWI